MSANQLKETTMDPAYAPCCASSIDEDHAVADTNGDVDDLMGTKAEARFRFIQENAEFAKDLDI
jgi:topoisomerase-4 subunit B